MELTDRQLPFELKIYMDEAGRGPLAGPVSVGTVIQTSSDLDKSNFADSKKLSPKKREAIYEIMCSDACRDVGLPRPNCDNVLRPLSGLPSLLFSVGFASAHEIDEYGIIGSLQIASVRSLFQTIHSFYEKILRLKLEESVWGEDHIFQIVMDNECCNASATGSSLMPGSDESTLSDACDASLQEQLQFLRLFFHTSQRQFAYKGLYIDGNHTFGLDTLLDLKVQTIIKGDARNPMIGAASIAAKVERDSYMKQIDCKYPGWGFAKHKGYGTKTHRDVILEKFHTLSSRSLDHGRGKPTSLHSGGQQGLTPEHRITFLSRICSGESHK